MITICKFTVVTGETLNSSLQVFVRMKRQQQQLLLLLPQALHGFTNQMKTPVYFTPVDSSESSEINDIKSDVVN